MATPIDKYSYRADRPEDVDAEELALGYDPMDAEEYAVEQGIDPNATVLATLTPAEKERLMKMCKHHEFNKREAAVLKMLMGEIWNLDDIGAFLGAASPKTKGKPMSRVAAKKELDRIVNVVGKRAKLQLGREVDLNQIPELKRQMKATATQKKLMKRDEERRRKELMKEFWAELKEVNKVRKGLGLPADYSLVPKAYSGQREF